MAEEDTIGLAQTRKAKALTNEQVPEVVDHGYMDKLSVAKKLELVDGLVVGNRTFSRDQVEVGWR